MKSILLITLFLSPTAHAGPSENTAKVAAEVVQLETAWMIDECAKENKFLWDSEPAKDSVRIYYYDQAGVAESLGPKDEYNSQEIKEIYSTLLEKDEKFFERNRRCISVDDIKKFGKAAAKFTGKSQVQNRASSGGR